MKMTRRISKRLRRFALFCFMAAGSAGFSMPHPLLASDLSSTRRLADSGELCGWVEHEDLAADTCNYDTWKAHYEENANALSNQEEPRVANSRAERVAVPEQLCPPNHCAEDFASDDSIDFADDSEFFGPATHDSVPSAPSIPEKTNNDSTFETSIAAIAAAACAGTGVSFEQMTEPFAMVGTRYGTSGPRLSTFQKWWIEAAERHAAEQLEKEKEIAAAELLAAKAVDEAEANPIEDESQISVADADAAAVVVRHTSEEEYVEVAAVKDLDIGHVPVVDFNSEISDEELWAESIASDEFDAGVFDEQVESDLDRGEDANLAAVRAERAFQAEVDRLADEEPLDADEEALQVFGPSVITPEDTSIPTSESTVESFAVSSDSFVGSAPIICTIPEAYLPYDLAARDRDSLGMFPSSKQPFCVLSEDSDSADPDPVDWSPLASTPQAVTSVAPSSDTNESLAAETEKDDFAGDVARNADRDVAVDASRDADCLLEDLVWHVQRTWENQEIVGQQLSVEPIGQEFAALVVSGDQLVDRIANSLALVWPVNRKGNGDAGAELLARAKASEQVEPVDNDQLADATATLLQWVDAAQSYADTISQHWLTVTEVAHHSGTQDQPARR